MTPADKIRSVFRELGIHCYQLVWHVAPDGKPHHFRAIVRDVTIHGNTVRSTIRAIRRQFKHRVAA